MTAEPIVATAGEAMALVSSTGAGRLRVGADLRFSFGGAESNVAIGLARLGHRTRWVSRVGEDAFGEAIEAGLRAERVETIVEVDRRRPTGMMVKRVSRAGATQVTYRRDGSAASALSSSSVEPLLDGASHLHLTGVTPALSDSARSFATHAAAHARQRGITVSLDVNYRSGLWSRGDAVRTLTPLLGSVDLLFGGRDELAMLETSEHGDVDVLLAGLAARGPREVVLKDGAHGATTWRAGALTSASAHTLTPVDTVGAGDAFVAGYLSAVLDDASIADRLARGHACGALVCLDPGDWEGAPDRRELEAFIGGADPVTR